MTSYTYTAHAPGGLTSRARSFVGVHGLRVPTADLGPYRDRWLGVGIPAHEIDRVVAYQERWGGLALPPAPAYEGGPLLLSADVPEGSADEGWWFWAGDQRVSIPYSFVIGPGGEFGIRSNRWTPLHASIEGWVESLALAHHAALFANSVTRVTGEAVDALQLEGYERVAEIQGLADTWWRGTDSLVAVYRGEAECLDAPRCRTALVYDGLDAWGIR